MISMNFEFGEMLMLQRHKNKMTQKWLAFELGVSVRTISRWENNETTPDPLQIEKLSKLLTYEFYLEAKYILEHPVYKKRNVGKISAILLGTLALIENIVIVVLIVRS